MFNNNRDLAIMFVNIYLSLGGELFKDSESPKIAIRNKIGIKAADVITEIKINGIQILSTLMLIHKRSNKTGKMVMLPLVYFGLLNMLA